MTANNDHDFFLNILFQEFERSTSDPSDVDGAKDFLKFVTKWMKANRIYATAPSNRGTIAKFTNGVEALIQPPGTANNISSGVGVPVTGPGTYSDDAEARTIKKY